MPQLGEEADLPGRRGVRRRRRSRSTTPDVDRWMGAGKASAKARKVKLGAKSSFATVCAFDCVLPIRLPARLIGWNLPLRASSHPNRPHCDGWLPDHKGCSSDCRSCTSPWSIVSAAGSHPSVSDCPRARDDRGGSFRAGGAVSASSAVCAGSAVSFASGPAGRTGHSHQHRNLDDDRRFDRLRNSVDVADPRLDSVFSAKSSSVSCAITSPNGRSESFLARFPTASPPSRPPVRCQLRSRQSSQSSARWRSRRSASAG